MRLVRKTQDMILALCLALSLVMGCAGLAAKKFPQPAHPEELAAGEADCTECHEDELTGTLKPYDTFRHTNRFLLDHGTYGSRDRDLCTTCHSEPFCLGCHATSEELGPDLRFGNEPRRRVPHRGEYLTRHQIDGRTDPGSCVKCHGNRNDGSCAVCH